MSKTKKDREAANKAARAAYIKAKKEERRFTKQYMTKGGHLKQW